MPEEPEVVRIIRSSRERVLGQDATQMAEMAGRWLEVERSMSGSLDALSFEVAQLRAQGVTVGRARLVQMERYQQLLAQARVEIAKYNRWADDRIQDGQRWSVDEALRTADKALVNGYLEAGTVVADFNRMPVSAVEAMIGLAGNGSPLYQLLAESYPDAVDGMTKALIDAIARGLNPRDTARLMADGLGIGLDRSLVIARTEQLRAYRESSRMFYQESGVVSGYRRIAAKQDRTCPACLFADGTFYKLESSFEEHPNGRCTLVPVVVELPPLEWQTGMAWFAEQGEGVQMDILGPAGFDAWSSGKMGLDDFIVRRDDGDWGAALVTANVT